MTETNNTDNTDKELRWVRVSTNHKNYTYVAEVSGGCLLKTLFSDCSTMVFIPNASCNDFKLYKS